MRDIILKALGELNIPVYQIEISEERSAELFFIKKTLDMRRIKSAVHCAVTVYRDFEADGETFRGSSQAQIFEGMPSTLADRPLEENAMLMAKALFAADTDADAFINSAEFFAIENRVSLFTSAGTDVAYSRYLVKGEFVTQCKEPQDVEQFFQFAYADLNTEALTEKTRCPPSSNTTASAPMRPWSTPTIPTGPWASKSRGRTCRGRGWISICCL